MQRFQTRTSSNTPLLIAAVGIGALVAYGLSSPRRRAALIAAGETALEAGSRFATTSAERLHDLVPQQALDAASGLMASARSSPERAASATADTLHAAADRAGNLMHDVRSRSRRLPEYAHSSSGRGVMIAAAALGAGLYAMQRYGASERVREKLGADETGTITVEKTIFIDAPVEQVFDTWANYENFPRFMSNVESVEPLGGARSHWKVRGPAGVGIEFDSVAYKRRPDELSWRSEPGRSVQTEGQVRFVTQGSGTLATVRMSYRPPAGVLGQAVSSLFGANPKQELEEDLNRMKQFIEGQGRDASQSA